MNIPSKYTLNGQPIIIEVVDKLQGSRYGEYNDAKETIKIAKTVTIGNESVELSDMQMLNTVLHEVIHSIQFHLKGETDEAEASSYAGMLSEFLYSSNLIDKLRK